MKKVILIHRWSGNPKSDWYPSISESLKKEDFLVEIPEMPNTETPEIEIWVNKLKNIVPKPDKETFFIGHSIGCQTILRYLEQLDKRVKVGKVVLVAPWFNLQNLDKESEKIAKPWTETPIDLSKVKSHLTEMTSIFSDNDEWVSLSDKEIFKSILNAKIIVEHNKGHFTSEDKIIEFPLVVKEIVTTE
jgi:uncharacterized protein